MKSLLVTFISTLVLCACASQIPARMSAQYEARNGDFIIIEWNGEVYWSPLSKTKEKLKYIGKLAAVPGNDLNPRLNVHGASIYVATVLEFEHDFKQLRIDWGAQATDVPEKRAQIYTIANGTE